MKTVTSKDGTSIAYTVTGTGPALIYIYGATCFKDFMPIKQDVKAFAQAFTVYNYDRRGRGQSDDTQPWTLQKEIDDIEAIADAAGGQVLLYGHSSGAVLALEAALALQGKVAKIAVYDASYIADVSEKPEYQTLEDTVQSHLKAGKNAKALRTFMQGIGMPAFLAALMPLFPGWQHMKRLAPTLIYDINLTKDVPPLQRLSTIPVPVLVLSGSKNPPVITNVHRMLAANIPGNTSEIIQGQDHLVSAKVLLPRLTAFFNEEPIA
jgi:pimeloyl-ACP methyl ester carboxylesterase